MVRVKDAKIVGFSKSDFTNQNTGERIFGYMLYCSYEDENIEGYGVCRCYCSANVFKKMALDVGVSCRVAYSNKKYELVA